MVAPDVPAGRYDVRARYAGRGVGFRSFVVGDWPEAVEAEPNQARPGTAMTLPVVINGVVGGNVDIDQFIFAARKGQRSHRRLLGLADRQPARRHARRARPQGREIAYAGDVHGRDPMIDFTAPEDGDYTIKVWDFVYGGGGKLLPPPGRRPPLPRLHPAGRSGRARRPR
ncbi:MAG: hypothetical protein WKF75_09400 [Singulisphaera sp.]